MKTTKIAILFYNSIIIFALITTGFVTSSYSDLTPTLLLIPVWLYFQVSAIDEMVSFSQFTHNKNVVQLIKIMRSLRAYSFIVVSMMIVASFVYSSNFFESTFTILLLPLLTSFFTNIFNKDTYSQFKIKNIINLVKLIKSTNKETTELKKENVVTTKTLKTKAKASKSVKKVEVEDQLDVNEGELIEEDVSDESSSEIVDGEIVEEDPEFMNITDHKRRQFLKIVGGGGVSMFLMLFVFQQKASAAFFGSGGGPGIVAVKDSSGDTIDPAEKQPTDGYSISEIDDNTLPSYYGFVHKDGNWYIAKEDSSGSYRYVSGASSFSTNWTNRASLTYNYFDDVF